MSYFDYYDIWGDPRNRRVESVPVTFSRKARLNTAPHYTDSKFQTAQTVFGQESDELFYVYSDRLFQWDFDKAAESTAKADELVDSRQTAEWYDAYISAYQGKPCQVDHILSGWNVATGYPYYVLGYRELEGDHENS